MIKHIFIILSAFIILAVGSFAQTATDSSNLFENTMQTAMQGDAKAQYNIGQMYIDGKGVQQDYTLAVKWYRLSAEQGLAKAQTILAHMYASGNGVAQNYTQAVKWYRLAAEQEHAGALYTLGFLYKNGIGLQQDIVLAYMWINLATKNNNAFKKALDLITLDMNPQRIAKAEELTKKCLASNYKNCP